jgi:uncharacterized membrane protein YgdD (TMEM256/DUF423 family)
MRWDRRTWMMLAAVSGLASVTVGAFAAHAMADPTAKAWLTTGAHYQLMHALACMACATLMQVGARRARFAPAFFLAGTVLFSGSLYAMALGAPRALGAVTPVGGLLFMVGWGVMIWSARDVDRSPVRAA